MKKTKLITQMSLTLCLALSCRAALADTVTYAPQIQSDTENQWALQISGTAQHFSQPTNTSRRYNQENWGVGLEYHQHKPDSRWTRVYTIGSLKDSLGNWGGYSGIAEEYTIGHIRSLAIQPGAGLFLFYRTFDFNGPHRWLLAPVPVLHLEETHSGIGLNLVLVPSLKLTNTSQLTGFAFFQGTIRF